MTPSKLRKAQAVITIFVIIQTSTCLMTGTQISQKCHCDITSIFCDFGCCCDTDCGSSISESCFYQKSSYYCPKTDFFKSIKPGSSPNKMCYYYNATITTVNEQALTSTQRTRLVSENAEVKSAASTVNAGYKGYKMGTVLTIGGKKAFSFVDNNGNCLNSTSSNSNYNIKFGLNTKISCICNNCRSPLLFSEIMGKSIPKYLELSSNDIQIPSITDSSISTLKINIIIGKYGSQKINYIDRITHSYESSVSSTTRTLYINFITSDNIKQIQNSASFFPQIPIDMFYPIHLIS